jgi:PAS domain S-box-containing protein
MGKFCPEVASSERSSHSVVGAMAVAGASHSPKTPGKPTEAHLLANEQTLAILLDGIGDHAIYMLDSQGRIASWNTGAARIKGYRTEEVLGKSIAMFYLPADIARGVPERGLQEALIHGRYEAEGQRVRKDGSTFWAHVALFPIFDSRKQLLGFAKVLRDISERKKNEKEMEESLRASEEARKELADFKYAIDQHSIVATTDVRGRITYVNDKFCKISQYSRAELLGQDHRIINSGHHPKQFFRELYQTVVRGQVWHAEICNRAKDGSLYWVDTTIIPLVNPNGKPRQYIAIRTDITERKCGEQTLARQSDELKTKSDELAVTNQALAEQTRMLESVLNSIGEGLAAVDAQGRFTLWNPMARSILGAGPSVAPREQWPEIYGLYRDDGDTPYPAEQLPLVQALKGQATREELFVRSSKMPEGTWIEVNAQPLRDERGEISGAVAAFRDITARRATEEVLREQAVILEMTQVFVRDIGDRIVLWNRGAADLYGFSKEEAIGHVSHELLRTEFPEPVDEIKKCIMRDGHWKGELVHHKKDGGEIVVSSLWLLQRDGRGRLLHILETNIDITQRKRDEVEICRLKDEMEERVIQRTAQLEAANRELEAFTYSVSHDLRAPLRHIAGFSGILMEEFSAELKPEARRHLERIVDGTRRMGQLVDEMLNLARVGRHALKMQLTNLNTILGELLPILHAEYQGRTVEWDVAKITPALCDPVLVKQVLQNLLSNAVKFTRTRERAIVAVGEIKCGLDTAIFVRDNGVGFDMRYADKLFGVFQRLHRAEEFEGTGVGLATVHRIVQKHGGRVWAESVPDKGTTFYFTLGTTPQANALNEGFTAIGASL